MRSRLSESAEGFLTRFPITKIRMVSGFYGREAAVREKVHRIFALLLAFELFPSDFSFEISKENNKFTTQNGKSRLTEIPLN